MLILNLDLRKTRHLRVPKSEGIEGAGDSKIKKGGSKHRFVCISA
jgi:hypothetical protein